MDVGTIIALLTGFLVAGIMVILGIVQIRSKKPVGFYTGEKPFAASELSDVHAWNISHGIMWVVYGLIIAGGFIVGAAIMDSILCLIPIMGSILIPLPVLILVHHCLIKKYKVC